MTVEPSRLHSIKSDIIDKSVHTSNGVFIGNIHNIDNDSVVVKGDIVSTVYYHIPIEKVREWDGHALWLSMDDKEYKKHILLSDSRKDSIVAESLNLELEEDTLNQVTQRAEDHGVSINSYINQIINRYLEWDKFEPKADIVTISKPVAKELFDNLGEEQIISMAEITAKNVLQKTVIKFLDEQQQGEETEKEGKKKKKLDMNSFLSWLEAEMNSYAIEIRHIIGKKEDKYSVISHSGNVSSNNCTNHHSYSHYHKYILKHDTGQNYSLYLKTILESIFNEILRRQISIKTTTAMLSFEFEE